MIDEVLARDDIQIDAVVLPMRDLKDAANSRIILERQFQHKRVPWITRLASPWSSWALTPGGSLLSLHPLDQGRLLATGFYQLVERLTKANIPMVFLSFPRLIEDEPYLFERLRPVLAQTVTAELAREAHQRVADLSKVRVRGEPETVDGGGGDAALTDNAALRRELLASRRREAAAQAQLAQLADQVANARAEIAALSARSDEQRKR